MPTLGSVSTTEGEQSSQFANALAQIFEKAAVVPPSEVDPPFELPEIVPATVELPVLPAASTLEAPLRPPPVQPASGEPRPNAAPATAWGDHLATVPGDPLRAPGRRPRVRKVTRVLRHIDPWSTFKVGLIFSAVAYVVLLTSGVLLWRVADSTGTLDNVERWFTQFGWETFELKGGDVFANAWVIGLFGVVGLTGGLVLLATLFNLVSDIVGGVRMTVLEEEVVERTISSTRRYVVRRPPTIGTVIGAAASQSWDVDVDPVAPVSTPANPDWSVED